MSKTTKACLMAGLLLVGLAINARATMPVVDYSHIAQDAANEVVNLAKWTKTEVDQAQTEINTLRTYENTVLQVVRMGNPAALQNIPVIGSITQLVGSGQKLLGEYQEIRALTNPQYLQGNLSSVQSAYQLQRWNPCYAGAYQFPSASYQVSQTVQDQMTAIEKQRQGLEQQRDAVLSKLQAATTASDVQKYSAAVVGVNGALAELSARANELAQRSVLQQKQLNAGAAIQRQQTTESAGTLFSQGIGGEMDELNALAPDYTKTPHWIMP